MRIFLMATCAAILPMMAQANDGFGGITATGLTFSQTEDVAMLTEDLYISQDKMVIRPSSNHADVIVMHYFLHRFSVF